MNLIFDRPSAATWAWDGRFKDNIHASWCPQHSTMTEPISPNPQTLQKLSAPSLASRGSEYRCLGGSFSSTRSNSMGAFLAMCAHTRLRRCVLPSSSESLQTLPRFSLCQTLDLTFAVPNTTWSTHHTGPSLGQTLGIHITSCELSHLPIPTSPLRALTLRIDSK